MFGNRAIQRGPEPGQFSSTGELVPFFKFLTTRDGATEEMMKIFASLVSWSQGPIPVGNGLVIPTLCEVGTDHIFRISDEKNKSRAEPLVERLDGKRKIGADLGRQSMPLQIIRDSPSLALLKAFVVDGKPVPFCIAVESLKKRIAFMAGSKVFFLVE